MREMNHDQLVTLVRNSGDSEMFVHVNGQSYCCNPSDEVRGKMAAEVALAAESQGEEVAVDPSDENQGDSSDGDDQAGDQSSDTETQSA